MKEAARGVVSLWDLMTILCAVTPLSVALGVAQFERRGFVLAAVLGLILGALCTYAVVAANRWIDPLQRWNGLKPSQQNRRFRALYLGLFAWVLFICPFLSYQTTTRCLRLFQ
jgi:hypothetical protein